jgi:pimeloyl-ACP methyl ester carboxylesterase
VDILHDILPNCELHVLTGQGHLADITAPEMVASALREFLLGV